MSGSSIIQPVDQPGTLEFSPLPRSTWVCAMYAKMIYNGPAVGGTTNDPISAGQLGSSRDWFYTKSAAASGWAAYGDPPVLLPAIRPNSPRATRAKSDLPLGSNQSIALHQNKSGSGLGNRKNQTEERRGLNREGNGARHQKTERYPGATQPTASGHLYTKGKMVRLDRPRIDVFRLLDDSCPDD